jgi:hypothetical protein
VIDERFSSVHALSRTGRTCVPYRKSKSCILRHPQSHAYIPFPFLRASLSLCIKYSSLSLTRKDMYPILATHFLHPCMTLRRVAWCYIHMTIRSQNMCESCFGRHKQRSRQQSVVCHFPGPFAIQACNSFVFMFTVRGNCNHIIRFRRSPVSSRTLICYSRIPPTAGTRASYRSGICFPRPSVIPVFPPHA